MQRRNVLSLGVLAMLLLLVTGCGGSSSTSSRSTRSSASQTASTTTEEESPPKFAEPPAAHVVLTSSAFQAGRALGRGERAIATRYTCDGSDISPAVNWSGVPEGTTELLLVALDFEASNGSTRRFAWGVAGLKPTLTGLAAGHLPAGATVGRNEFGQDRYSVCPPRGRTHNYFVFLYALPHRMAFKSGFDVNAAYVAAEREKLASGQSGFAYKRR
jgi:Raf kinase inhibitor-like YbhB/YbcL family protein